MYTLIEYKPPPGPWNKGKIVGPKPPLRPQEVWSIRIHLQMKAKRRDLALFNLAIDSKLRGCDLVRLKVGDVAHGCIIQSRAKIIQQKTLRPVQFEITDQTGVSLEKWIAEASLRPGDFLFPSRLSASPHVSTRQYARIVASWIKLIGLDPSIYGTHSMRRTKASLIYRRTRRADRSMIDCPRGECLEGARRADIGVVDGSTGEIDPQRTFTIRHGQSCLWKSCACKMPSRASVCMHGCADHNTRRSRRSPR